MEFALPPLRTDGMLKLQNLTDAAKCYETVRQMRWPAGVACPHCTAQEVTKRGRDVNPRQNGSASSGEAVGGSVRT